jgi:predicted nicotinamide N-methyase
MHCTDDGRESLGQRIWHSARVTCAFIESYPALFAGARVLELGSGTGLCGLVAAAAPSVRCVVLSDGLAHGQTLALAQANAILNGLLCLCCVMCFGLKRAVAMCRTRRKARRLQSEWRH